MTLGNARNEIKTALKALFLAEKQPGGRLTEISRVGMSWYNHLDDYPYIGISWIEGAEVLEASRSKRITIQWGITLITRSTGPGASLEAATEQRDALLDDSNGRGLEAVLRDTANITLGGLLTKMQVTHVKATDNLESSPQASPTSFLAYGAVMLETTQLVGF